MALHFPSVLSAGLWGYTFTGGGLFLPLVIGLLWKDKSGKTCVTKNAAIASLLIGGTTAVGHPVYSAPVQDVWRGHPARLGPVSDFDRGYQPGGAIDEERGVAGQRIAVDTRNLI